MYTHVTTLYVTNVIFKINAYLTLSNLQTFSDLWYNEKSFSFTIRLTTNLKKKREKEKIRFIS